MVTVRAEQAMPILQLGLRFGFLLWSQWYLRSPPDEASAARQVDSKNPTRFLRSGVLLAPCGGYASLNYLDFLNGVLLDLSEANG